MSQIAKNTLIDQKNLERLKEAVFKSDTEKFYALTALMKRQILMDKMTIIHK